MLPADLPQAEREAAIAATLVRREGSPQMVARTVISLVENEFITGVCLPVDGGRTIAP
jgi:pteridine reductase